MVVKKEQNLVHVVIERPLRYLDFIWILSRIFRHSICTDFFLFYPDFIKNFRKLQKTFGPIEKTFKCVQHPTSMTFYSTPFVSLVYWEILYWNKSIYAHILLCSFIFHLFWIHISLLNGFFLSVFWKTNNFMEEWITFLEKWISYLELTMPGQHSLA